jgi:hypothetical protein
LLRQHALGGCFPFCRDLVGVQSRLWLLYRLLGGCVVWQVCPEVHIAVVLRISLGVIGSVEFQPPCIQVEIRIEADIAVEPKAGASLLLDDFPMLLGVTFYSKQGLRRGRHTLRIVCRSDARINLEGFRVYA